VLRPTGYDGQLQELIDLMAVITDEPPEFFFPEPNYLPIDRPFLEDYIPQMLEDAPYHEGIKYTYAQRMRSWFGNDQIEEVITKLINEIDTASAVINLWDSGDNFARRFDGSSDHQHSGSPCLNHVWLRVVDRHISLTAILRSNDMFGA
jgi:thymidylate synthase